MNQLHPGGTHLNGAQVSKDAGAERVARCEQYGMNQVLKARNVLVIDDDRATQSIVTCYFQDNNIPAKSVYGCQELRRYLGATDASIIILDMLTGQDKGLDILREIRSISDIPVIMTGYRKDEADSVVALELGADDYIAKPFVLRELLARVRAVLRRCVSRTSDPERGGYRFNGWQLERRQRRLFDPDGAPVPLGKSEYTLLLAFLKAPQRPLTREHLLEATRVHQDLFDRSIDVQVLRLRRKLEVHASTSRLILTERGVGYLFAARVEPF
jgi:DNA-binding response OmpR family regulator